MARDIADGGGSTVVETSRCGKSPNNPKTREGDIYGSTDNISDMPYISCWVEPGERLEVVEELDRYLDMAKVTPNTKIGTVTFDGGDGIDVEVSDLAIEDFGYDEEYRS